MKVKNSMHLYIILFVCFLVFGSCKKKEIENINSNNTIKKAPQQINFDLLLHCSEYTFQDNYFLTSDYGCIYNPKDKNSYGNLILYLIPIKTNQNGTDIEIQKINTFDNKKIKKDFTIYAFLIPASYLIYNPKADPVYYQKEKFKEELYTFDSNLNKWILIDSIQISDVSQNDKEQSWRENFITSKVVNPKRSKQLEYVNGYYAHDSLLINLKTKKYKVIALEINKEKNNAANTHFNLPLLILEEKEKKYVEIKRNNNLLFEFDDNCPANGYESLVTKGNYFTLQQSSCMDFLFVNSYTTFKIDELTNEIYLHKYGEEYLDRSNPDKKISSKTWSTKDFGIIKFENANTNSIMKLRRTTPK